MRGDTHVGFGGRPRETDPGNPDTAPVPDPTAATRRDHAERTGDSITAGQRQCGILEPHRGSCRGGSRVTSPSSRPSSRRAASSPTRGVTRSAAVTRRRASNRSHPSRSPNAPRRGLVALLRAHPAPLQGGDGTDGDPVQPPPHRLAQGEHRHQLGVAAPRPGRLVERLSTVCSSRRCASARDVVDMLSVYSNICSKSTGSVRPVDNSPRQCPITAVGRRSRIVSR